jgi:hypothetical protein
MRMRGFFMSLKRVSKMRAYHSIRRLVRLCGVLGVIFLAAAATSGAAVIVQTTDFIASPTNFNGFEGIGPDIYPGNAGYTEGGIVVTYVGVLQGGIWTTLPGGQGTYNWYPDNGGTGYTDIKLTGGSEFAAIDFLAGSGWGLSSLQYQVLDKGVVIASGNAGLLPQAYTSFIYYGFSGGTFDEIQLQAQNCSDCAFNSGAFEALALDNISIGDVGGGPVPEPASFLLIGVGLAGIVAIRRRRA